MLSKATMKKCNFCRKDHALEKYSGFLGYFCSSKCFLSKTFSIYLVVGLIFLVLPNICPNPVGLNLYMATFIFLGGFIIFCIGILGFAFRIIVAREMRNKK